MTTDLEPPLADIGLFLKGFSHHRKLLQQKKDQEARLCAPYFNIFRLLGIERNEALLHTRFLAELLSPRGSHGQGIVFLKNFFDVAGGKAGFTAPSDLSAGHQWSIQCEVFVGGGNILDLRIENPILRYTCVIENKIDAGEGDEQLSRYARWMMQSRRDYKVRQLVFLTPTGRISKTSGEFSYACLSYRDDLVRMLNASLASISAAPVVEVVKQYLYTVERLTTEESLTTENVATDPIR
jgi:hypothetical protein